MNGFIGVLKTILKFIVFCRHPEHVKLCILEKPAFRHDIF